jgi:hypothetical protein
MDQNIFFNTNTLFDETSTMLQPSLGNLAISNSFNDWTANWDSMVNAQISQTASFDQLMDDLMASLPVEPSNTIFSTLMKQCNNSLLIETGALSPLSMTHTNSMASNFTVSPTDSNGSFADSSTFNLSPTDCDFTMSRFKNPELPMKVNSKIPSEAFRKVIENGSLMYYCNWKDCKRKFTRRSANCRAHWLRHNDMAPFVCLTCSLGFRKNTDLVRHKTESHTTI